MDDTSSEVLQLTSPNAIRIRIYARPLCRELPSKQSLFTPQGLYERAPCRVGMVLWHADTKDGRILVQRRLRQVLVFRGRRYANLANTK